MIEMSGMLEIETIFDKVNPEVWGNEIPGRAKNALSVKIQVKDPTHYPNKKQYPIKHEAKAGL